MLKKKNQKNIEIFLDHFKSLFKTNENKILDNKSVMLPNANKIVKPFIIKENKSPIKTINYINNDSGKMRHFTPAAQE